MVITSNLIHLEIKQAIDGATNQRFDDQITFTTS
jgi:hypothetical protein